MRGRPLILRWASIFLLLIFTQKIGLGLTVHNIFHGVTQGREKAAQKQTHDRDISYACSCAEDCLLPFVPADEIVIADVETVIAPLSNLPVEKIPFHARIFSSLRGPPASPFYC